MRKKMRRGICYWCLWYKHPSKYDDARCKITLSITKSNWTCDKFKFKPSKNKSLTSPLPLVQGGGK